MTDDTGESARKAPAPGRSFGPYKIIEPLGAGGMGEVYRARDSKLNRDVALKFLPEELSSDEQLLARFDREAKLLALVNHPNIATIHSIEEENGHPYLVLELVEGQNLSAVLKAGPLTIREALRVCRDIAAALEAAHSKGIVHRDLKPANVIVTPEGVVKVLDFGIAKPLKFSQAASDLAENTPSEELTITGTLIGTGPYMSPEQVRGKSAGTHVDIWAFGCLTYQVLTGKPAFGRDTLADTLTSILEREPDWSRLPARTPESIKRLMKRCVKKDPSQRLQAIGDARIEIEEAIRTPSRSGEQAAGETGIPAWQLIAGAATMLAIGIVLGAVAIDIVRPSAPPPAGFQSFDFMFPEVVVLGLGNAPSLAVSREGTSVVAVFRDGLTQQLYRRELDSPAGWTAIPGTDGAESPFFSWEGDRIGFFADSKLWWIPYDGSSRPALLADAVAPRGGAWAFDGTIYYSSNQTLWTTGIDRAPRAVDFDGGADRRWPLILPDGETLLYTRWDGAGSNKTSVYMRSAATEEALVIENAGYARYSPSQHLVFNRGDELHAIGFNPNSLSTSGDAILLNEPILVYAEIGVPFFDIAQQGGTFVHAPGGLLRPGPVLAWMDARGRPSVPEPLLFEDYQAGIKFPRLSRDGNTLAVTIDGGGGGDEEETYAALIELVAGGGVLSPVVGGGATTYAPEWNPEGDYLAYLSFDHLSIFSKPVRATGDGRQLTEASISVPVPTGWRNGRIFYNRTSLAADGTSSLRDVWYVSTSPGAVPAPFLVTDYDEYGAVPSPNGNLVAYVRRETGQEPEVWVTLFSKDVEQRVSTSRDCQEPTWSGDGRALYFRCGDEMMAVDIRETPSGFDPGDPQRLWNWRFADDFQSAKANYAYDAVRERFLMVSDDPIVTAVHLKVLQNWHENLKARAARAGR